MIVELYEIEAEIPPHCPMLCVRANGDPAIAAKDENSVTCMGPELVEAFASIAAMRWRDVYTSMEKAGALTPRQIKDIGKLDEYDRAREQFGEWNEIRLRAIKAQKK